MKGRALRVGDRVVVRSPEEILSTLDADGTLDHVPFMPEMLDCCGKAFRVQRRVEKTCVTDYPVRRFPANDVVILDSPRCDGQGHGGCKRCLQDFLERSSVAVFLLQRAATPSTETSLEQLRGRLKVKSDEKHYFCQSTELFRATENFPRRPRFWTLRIPFKEIRNGDLSVVELLRLLALWSWLRFCRAVGGDSWLHGPHKRTPVVSLGLKPGEVVRVKSRAQIVATLDQKSCNRGLGICHEVTRCCGYEAEVRYRVDRLIDERTGAMREITRYGDAAKPAAQRDAR